MKRMMVSLFIVMVLGIVNGYSYTGWSTTPMRFYLTSVGQSTLYSTYYDASSSQSMVTEIDYCGVSGYFTGGNFIGNLTSGSSTGIYKYTIRENENPKLYATVNSVINQLLNGVNQIYAIGAAGANGNTAFCYFVLYYSADSETSYDRKILGIRVLTYRN